jgi:hypothetical protein
MAGMFVEIQKCAFRVIIGTPKRLVDFYKSLNSNRLRISLVWLQLRRFVVSPYFPSKMRAECAAMRNSAHGVEE